MTTPDPSRRALLGGAVAASLSVLLGPFTSSAQAADKAQPIVIIVSQKLETETISLAKLRRCYLGRKVELAGKRLIPFNHPPDNSLRERFDEKILGMSLVESQRYWIDSLIRGGPRPPRKVKDAELLAKVVAKLPGVIGYVDLKTGKYTPGVRILAIDGISYDSKRYPLR